MFFKHFRGYLYSNSGLLFEFEAVLKDPTSKMYFSLCENVEKMAKYSFRLLKSLLENLLADCKPFRIIKSFLDETREALSYNLCWKLGR